MFLTVLCGSALVGCFFGALTVLVPGSDEPKEPLSEAESFATLVGLGIFLSLFAFVAGAFALQDAPLDIPSSLTPARAFAANATGLVVMGCVAVIHQSICSLFSRST
ncbi:hypothetical protein C8T65DRAFT_644612 [Cerioporus squamosus]|nr:hypothetical protein C8T65DRAFT_644612 [Cerioporus squamosus]